MFLEIGKKPRFQLTMSGEKLTQSEDFKDFYGPLEFEGDPSDQGIMVPFYAWKEEKKREAEKEAELNADPDEEIVEW